MSKQNQTKKQLATCNIAKANLRTRADSCEAKTKRHKLREKVFDSSIKQFAPHTEILTNQCDVTKASLPEKTLKAIKTCVSQNPYYAHSCVKPVLKDICITIKAKTKFHSIASFSDPDTPFSYDHLNKTYIPFPNPSILNQFQKDKIQIDLFIECFETYEPERPWSKFDPSIFFSSVCYINFQDYQVLLGSYPDYQTLLDSYE